MTPEMLELIGKAIENSVIGLICGGMVFAGYKGAGKLADHLDRIADALEDLVPKVKKIHDQLEDGD